jgi:signal transduction histidine kinase
MHDRGAPMIPAENSSILLGLNEAEWCRFLGEAAHKMKNKIGGIHGFCSLLEKDLEEEDPRCRLVHKAQEAVLQLNYILTLYMRIFHQAELQPSDTDVSALLRDALLRYSGQASGRQAPALAAPEGSVTARVDPDGLMEWTVQALTFAAGVSSRIETLRLEARADGGLRIALEFALPREGQPANRSERIGELLLKAEPFELRLSLAVVVRTCVLLGGILEYGAPSPSKRLLTLQLNQG